MELINRILSSIYARARAAFYQRRYQEYRNRYNIGDCFGFEGTDIRLYGEGNIILNEKSYIGSNSTMQSGKNCTIEIGKHCRISHNVRIYTVSSDPDQDFREGEVKPHKKGDVIIGDGVWIGANVFINPNIKIGNNSVIGANSVVTKDVPANTIAGGVPAKLIKTKSK